MTFGKNRSEVWKHFLLENKGKSTYKCKHCSVELKFHSSTSSFLYHLEHKHKIYLTKVILEKSKNIQPSIATYCNNTGSKAEDVLARLTAVDRIPFATLANSKDIKNGWKAQGLKIPDDRHAIKTIVMNYANSIKLKVVQELQQKKLKGERFSISLDEWTSGKTRRYLCLNVHCSDKCYYGLGMIRINGSLPSERAVNIVIEKLNEFGLNLINDVFGYVTDGASVMKKMGREMGVIHQLCYCHGIHLAVCDILYKKKCLEIETAQEEIMTDEIENETSDSDPDDENNTEECWNEESNSSVSQEIQFNEDYGVIILKVRKIVKLFRKSPLKNDSLQSICRTDLGKELKPILDTKTRWNSLISMLKRFLKLKNVIAKALVDISRTDLILKEEEIKHISDIVQALHVVELSVMELGKRDCDLIKSDKIILFLLQNLKEQNTNIGQKLFTVVSERIVERRNCNIAGLLCFLHNPTDYKSDSEFPDNLLKYPHKNKIAKTAREIYLRLFLHEEVEEAYQSELEYTCNEEPLRKKTKGEELAEIIANTASAAGKTKGITFKSSPQEVLTCIKREIAVLESTGNRPSSLEKIYNAILSLPPSSIEAERSFSAAGLFVTNLRTSLNDDTVDNLCFLRSFLIKREIKS